METLRTIRKPDRRCLSRTSDHGLVVYWLTVVWPIAVVLGLFLGLMHPTVAQTTSPKAQQFLLLKNDRVMQGRVETGGQNFAVDVAEGSRVFIPQDQVLFVGTSLNDLYQFKLRGMIKPNTGDHFKLTRWCMNNGLLDEAVTHYRQVSQAAGDHPRVKQLAVELKDQLLKVPSFRDYLGLPPLEAASKSLVRTASVSNAAAKLVSGVERAGGTQTARVPPPEVVARFKERVQPILLNRCSQSACHGGQTKTPLKLLEPHPRFGTQTSADNLRNVLAYISAEAQQTSPLVDYATRAHGLRRTPSIDITETQLMRELRDWIELVRNPVISAEGTSSRTDPGLAGGTRDAALSPAVRGAEPRPVPGSARSESLDQWQPPASMGSQGPASFPPVPVDVALPLPKAAEVKHPAASGSPIILPGAKTAADPFDPSAFNERVHGNSGIR